MGWHTSTRRDRLPSNWQQLRRDCFAKANGICEWRDNKGTRCSEPCTDCDHIQRGDDHSPSNLQGLCSDHHKKKTQDEAKRAQHAMYVTARKRTPERHPGTPV